MSEKKEFVPFDAATQFTVENDVLFADGRLVVVTMGEKGEVRTQRTEFIRSACSSYHPSIEIIEKLTTAMERVRNGVNETRNDYMLGGNMRATEPSLTELITEARAFLNKNNNG